MRNFVDYYIKFAEYLDHINDSAKHAPGELINQTEKIYNKRIDEIAEFIISHGAPGNKVVMLAGPSSSGKTTTAIMMCEAMKSRGTNAVRISLDNFFRASDLVPPLPNGERDYESINTLDIPLLNECLIDLIKKGRADLPKYDFSTGRPVSKRFPMELGGNDVVVVEGIHALNPAVTECLPDERMAKVYISVKQGIFDGDSEVITSQHIRLIRRLVRDKLFRSASAEHTFSMWKGVLKGEQENIYPNKRFANITINSLHIYEVGVMAPILMPILKEITPESKHYPMAEKLISELARFEPIDQSLVPEESLIREFIGGNKRKY